MKQETITSWAEIAALVEEHRSEGWLYRGERVGNNDLKPSIGRDGMRARALELSYDPALERELLSEFVRQARPLVPQPPPENRQLEWMALAQHHGLATRLLDWTESIFVAAFFATEAGITYERRFTTNIGNGHYIDVERPIFPVIYGIRGLTRALGDCDPFGLSDVMAYHPPHISPRIAPQMAAFTVHPQPTVPFDKPELVQWTLQIEGTIQIREALDVIGVSPAALFPGVDGLGRSLTWKYKWDRLRKPITPS